MFTIPQSPCWLVAMTPQVVPSDPVGGAEMAPPGVPAGSSFTILMGNSMVFRYIRYLKIICPSIFSIVSPKHTFSVPTWFPHPPSVHKGTGAQRGVGTGLLYGCSGGDLDG